MTLACSYVAALALTGGWNHICEEDASGVRPSLGDKGATRIFEVALRSYMARWPDCCCPSPSSGIRRNLVQRSIEGQLQATAEYNWRRDGLTVHVTVSLERLKN